MSDGRLAADQGSNKEKPEEKIQLLNSQLDDLRQEFKDFVDLAAHDLDSPLRKLLLFSEKLSEKTNGILPDEAKLYLSRIQACANDMRSLVDGLSQLSFSSQQGPGNRRCDLDKIARQVLTDLGLNASATIDGTLPTIEGDPEQLRTLFVAILDNAKKFKSADAPLQVTVSCVTEQDQNGRSRYKVMIADNGIGFPQDKAETIFKPFTRLNGKSEYPGAGLGLAIAKKIAQNHGGDLYAESLANSGSCFAILLPQTNN